MADLAGILADLAAESAAADSLVAELPEAEWGRATPAAGWTIAHQVGHLAWTDEVALLAATDADAFAGVLQNAAGDPYRFVDVAAERAAQQPPAVLLAGWRAGRFALAAALTAVPDGVRLPWFGPPPERRLRSEQGHSVGEAPRRAQLGRTMSAMSMATARLMETWAHGQDVADALGVDRPATKRLRHVAHIGVRTRDFAYQLRGLPVPAEPFRVDVFGPAGEVWTWGPADAAQRVTGPALDFCLLVTQRRHRADLAVEAIGAEASAWLDIAQAFAGPPGAGRPARGAVA